MKERTQMVMTRGICGPILAILLSPFVSGLQSDQSLIFREDWKEIPAETPITQEHVANPALRLNRHGTSGDQIKKSHHPEISNDPFYVWSGQCEGTWGLTLSQNDGTRLNLSGGMVRWRSRQSGGHSLRVLIRLSDGRFFVSDQGDSGSDDWHVHQFVVDELTWKEVDLQSFRLSSGGAGDPDITEVQEIGFTDLEAGRGSDYCSRLDWIEVYGARD